MFKTTAALSFAALIMSSGAALAWDDAYKGTYNDPNSNFRYNTVPGVANYCPAGLQPVQIGGEICCGVPNAGPYIDRAGGHRKAKTVYKRAPRPVTHAGIKGTYFTPEGVKGVVRQ
ncbi:hypothetical protein [Roseivivax sp. CAU 1753]